jgi:hypothetical protein
MYAWRWPKERSKLVALTSAPINECWYCSICFVSVSIICCADCPIYIFLEWHTTGCLLWNSFQPFEGNLKLRFHSVPKFKKPAWIRSVPNLTYLSMKKETIYSTETSVDSPHYTIYIYYGTIHSPHYKKVRYNIDTILLYNVKQYVECNVDIISNTYLQNVF